MYFDGEYRLLTKVDIAPLQAAVDALSEDDWYGDTRRQDQFQQHRDTQSIGLIYDLDLRHRQPTIRPAFERFRHVIEPILSTIAECYAGRARPEFPPYFARVILVRLGAGTKIPAHTDHGESLSRVHRIHIPVMTNPHVDFKIAGSVRHLAAGEAWEINNRVDHGVKNRGTTPRIHLILDYVIPTEIIHDPEGLLIA